MNTRIQNSFYAILRCFRCITVSKEPDAALSNEYPYSKFEYAFHLKGIQNSGVKIAHCINDST